MKASRFVTVKRELPHHPGEWWTFRLPSDAMIQAAREERRIFGIKQTVATREAFGAKVLEEFRQERERAREDAIARGEDPDAPPTSALARPRDPIAEAEAALDEFDRETLLRLGIAEWTVTDNQGNVLPITSENVRDLDAYTSKWAGLVLVQLKESGYDDAPVVAGDHGPVIDVDAAHPFDASSPSINGSYAAATAGHPGS